MHEIAGARSAVISKRKLPTAQFAVNVNKYSTLVITTRTNLFLKIQNFVLQLIIPSL